MPLESPIERLRHHLLGTLGLTALPIVTIACGGRQASDDEVADSTDDADDQDDASDDQDTEDESSDSGTSTSETGTDTDTTETDTGEPEDCTVTFHSMGSLEEFPDCTLPLENEFRCANAFYLACTPLLGDQSCDRQCPAASGVCGECELHSTVTASIGACGPYEVAGQCCSVVGLEDDCISPIDGRPFVVEGASRLPVIEGVDFDLRDPLRRHLAEHWARVAAAEHASVASFAQFALHLLALGVPPELIRDAFAAAGDEVRHAEAALAIASGHAGRSLRFGRLDVRGAAQHPQDLESLVTACVREGCIGETLAALELATAADCCDDPHLAALLRSIADDEARHAALAWRFVQWALDRDPGLRPEVASLFASWQPSSSPPPSLDRMERDHLRRHGCLDPETRRRVELEGLRQLLRPCANALLAGLDSTWTQAASRR